MKSFTLITLALTISLGYRSEEMSPLAATQSITDSIGPSDPLDHPLFDKEEMGYMVWTVMHMYSAFVPESPTYSEQRELVELITLL